MNNKEKGIFHMEHRTQVDLSGVNPDISRRSEIERLEREHRELKKRLSELNERRYLSPAEEVEKKTLQKLKLAKKDRLAVLVSYSGRG